MFLRALVLACESERLRALLVRFCPIIALVRAIFDGFHVQIIIVKLGAVTLAEITGLATK